MLNMKLPRMSRLSWKAAFRSLRLLLATAKIIEENGKKKSDMVQIGSKVTIKEGNYEPETFTIVGVAEANPREGKISNESADRQGHPEP